MTKRTAVFFGLALLAIGGLVWWFSTKKPITAKITKTIQPTLNSLAQNTISKAEVLELLAYQSLGVAPNPNPTPTPPPVIVTPPPVTTGGSTTGEDYLKAYLDKRGAL